MRDKLANRTAIFLEKGLDDLEFLNKFKRELDEKRGKPPQEYTKEDFISFFEFAFKALYGETFKLGVIFIIAYMLNVLTPILVITIVFCSTRLIAGGGHMDTFFKCLISTLITFMIGVVGVLLLNNTLFNQTQLYYIIISTYLISVCLSLKYAPRDNPNKIIDNPIKIKYLKRLTIIWITLVTVILSVFYSKNQLILFSGCMGMILEIFTLTPLSIKIFNVFDSKKESEL